MSAALRDRGKAGLIVDPDRVVIPPDGSEFENIRYATIEQAVDAAQTFIREQFSDR